MDLNKIVMMRARKLKNLFLVFTLCFFFFFQSCKRERSHSEHNERTQTSDSSLAGIIDLVDNAVISSQETLVPVVKESGNVIRVNGFIAPDPRRDQAVAARISGRVERLFVKYNYQFIQRGEKVLEIYSPELRASQEEYLYLLKTSKDEELINNGKKRLLLLGLSEQQIKNLQQSGKIALTISVFSPATGYVLLSSESSPVPANTKSNATNGMNMGQASNNSPSGNKSIGSGVLEEGSYIGIGQTLFRINDFKAVLASLTLDPGSQRIVKINTPVTLFPEGNSDKSIDGKIDFIEPVFSEGIQFLQARVYLKNQDHELKVNALVTAEIQASGQKKMVVPNTSISDLGQRKIVWVKTRETLSGKKVFEPRTVVAGVQFDDNTEIIEGLKEGESIAKHAGYLLDSESIIEK